MELELELELKFHLSQFVCDQFKFCLLIGCIIGLNELGYYAYAAMYAVCTATNVPLMSENWLNKMRKTIKRIVDCEL